MTLPQRKDSWRRKILVMSMLAASSPAAWAVKVDYRLGVAALYSDNLGLVAESPKSDGSIEATLEFIASHQSSRLRFAASGSAQYVKYVNGTFADGPRGTLAAQADWIVIPDVLEFVVADHLSRRPVDWRLAYSPANDQQINVLVAGPTLALRIDPVTRLRVDLRVSNTNASKSHEVDGQRYDALASVERRLSTNQSISLAAQSSTTRFGPVSRAFDYELTNGFVRYETRTRLTNLTADLGYSHVNVGRGAQRSSGPLIRLGAAWTPQPRHTLRTRLTRQFADTSEDVIDRSEIGRGGMAQAFLNAQGIVSPRVYLDRRALLAYEYRGERLNLRADAEKYWTKYLDQTGGRWSGLATSGSAEYQLSPRLTSRTYFGAFRRQDGDVPGSDRNLFAGTGLAFRWTSNWTVSADIQHRKRRTPFQQQRFDENSIVFYFGYRP